MSSHFDYKSRFIESINHEHKIKEIRKVGPRKRVKNGSKFSKNYQIITFQDSVPIIDIIENCKQSGFFIDVEPDYIGYGSGISPDDPIYKKRQYYHNNDGSFDFVSEHLAKQNADMDTDLAWEIMTGDTNTILGVFDTGLKLDHPEFESRLWVNKFEIPDNGIDDDNNGYIDDINGWDFVNRDNEPIDDHGHGTNVTGIAAATGNNGIGMAGMDWYCKIMPLKVLDENNKGFYADWIEALYYAADNGIHIGNMSLSGNSYSSILEDAVNYAYKKGVLVIASMGNQDQGNKVYPAGFENTMAVGATNPDDTRVTKATSNWGSNYGSHIDVVAPGVRIYSTRHNTNDSYSKWYSGTSQATPQVSGLACLLKGQDNSRSADQIREIIRRTAEDNVGDSLEDTNGFDVYYGYGRINAFKALSSEKIELDVSLESFIKESESKCGLSINPKLLLESKGLDSVYNILLALYKNNVRTDTVSIDVKLNQFQKDTLYLPIQEFISDGKYSFSVKLLSVNNSIDQNIQNDSLGYCFRLYDGVNHQFIIDNRSKNESFSFMIMDDFGPVIYSDSLGIDTTQNQTLYNFCLVDGCYSLQIDEPFLQNECNYDYWDENVEYCKGSQVILNQIIYESKWCGIGNKPHLSGPFDQWKIIDVCIGSHLNDRFTITREETTSLLEINVSEFIQNESLQFCSGIINNVLPISIKKNIKIYPNPVQEFLTISFTDTEAKKVSIYSVTGQLIYSSEFINQTKIYTGAWNAGLYYLHVNEERVGFLKE